MECPNCGTKIEAAATVDKFMSEPAWDFYGQQGKRWIICKKDKYVHFRVLTNNRSSHRMARCRQF